jgi:hypothetical protein
MIREMTKDEMYIFVHLSKMTDIEADGLYNTLIKEGGWVLEAISKRFKAWDLIVDKRVSILVFFIGDTTIGRCVKYVDDIYRICGERKITNLSFQDFSMNVYTDGFPDL